MNAPQGSLEWRQERLGVFSGSKIYDLVSPRKEVRNKGTKKADFEEFIRRKAPEQLAALGEKYTVSDLKIVADKLPPDIVRPTEFTKGALTYITKKAAEVVTPVIEDEIYSRSIEWGNEYEDEMFEKLSEKFGIDLETPPFLMSPCGNFGSSPDRVNHASGIVLEGKCPFRPAIFLKQSQYTLEEFKEDNPDYYWQCQAHIAVTGYECFFINYDPRVFNPKKRLSVLHIPKDEVAQEDLIYWTEKAEEKKQEIIQAFLADRTEGEELLKSLM